MCVIIHATGDFCKKLDDVCAVLAYFNSGYVMTVSFADSALLLTAAIIAWRAAIFLREVFLQPTYQLRALRVVIWAFSQWHDSNHYILMTMMVAMTIYHMIYIYDKIIIIILTDCCGMAAHVHYNSIAHSSYMLHHRYNSCSH